MRLPNLGSWMVVGCLTEVGAKVGANDTGTVSTHRVSRSPAGDAAPRNLTELAQFALRPPIGARASKRQTWSRPEARDNREAGPTLGRCTSSCRAFSHVTFWHCAVSHGTGSDCRTACSCLGWCHHLASRTPCSPRMPASPTVQRYHGSGTRGTRDLAHGIARSGHTTTLITLVSSLETRPLRPEPL